MADKVKFEDVRALRETTRAVLVSIDGDEYWVPKSQIDDDSEVWQDGQQGDLVVSEWWAAREGLS